MIDDAEFMGEVSEAEERMISWAEEVPSPPSVPELLSSPQAVRAAEPSAKMEHARMDFTNWNFMMFSS
jgi:hypothetical protein